MPSVTPSAPPQTLTESVRDFWEREACGTDASITGEQAEGGPEWYRAIEQHRYAVEPSIHTVAQFSRHHGERVLEVGVGAGTDHLQWARAGAECFGVDLTRQAIETTRAHLALYGFTSELQQANAERLPFEGHFFDVVYSWGVIHHAENPDRIVEEIHRVLKPGGQFIGMVYNRRSLVSFKFWVKFGPLAGRPLRSFADVLWHHMESVGTKAYSNSEARRLFGKFSHCSVQAFLTSYDTDRFPGRLARFFPDDWGWFLTVRARK